MMKPLCWISFKESKPVSGTVCLILSSYGIGVAEYKDNLGFCSDENDKYSIIVTLLEQQYDICNEDIEYWIRLDDIPRPKEE